MYSLAVTDFITPSYVTNNSMKLSVFIEFIAITLALHRKIKLITESEIESQQRILTLEKDNAIDKAIAQTVKMVVHDVRKPLDKMEKFLNRLTKKEGEELKTMFPR